MMSDHPITAPRTYVIVFLALMLLLALTIAAARVEHGALSMVLALAIAAAKAILIVLFFMQLRYESAVIRLAAVAGFLWLAFLIVLSLADLESRP